MHFPFLNVMHQQCMFKGEKKPFLIVWSGFSLNLILTCVWYVCGSHDAPDLFHGLQVWTEASVTAEDLLVHDGGDGQAVEAVRERLPQLDVESPLALVVESVDPVNTGALVVAPEQEEVLRVLDLVGQQEADGLQRLLAAVHVVAQEEVVGLWRKAAVLEQTQQVRVLAVDVT